MLMRSWFRRTCDYLLHKMAHLNLGQTPVSDQAHDWFRAMSNACGWSARSKISGMIEDYVRDNMAEFAETIGYAARKHGMSFDEAFDLLRRDQPLGEPVEGFSVIADMEEKLNGLAKK